MMLKNQLPNATQLSLADIINESPSAGTVNTIIDYVASGKPLVTMVKGNPALVELFYKTRSIEFSSGTKEAAFVPRGDIVSIYHR